MPDSEVRKVRRLIHRITSVPMEVVTDGSVPYREAEFDDILRQQGISVSGYESTNVETLILGRERWGEFNLGKFIESRQGQRLRVYSQEMFLAYLATGEDPHKNSELVDSFGAGHPALEFLSKWGFDWPHTDIVPGTGYGEVVEPEEWPQIGVLKHLGYSVGQSGLSRWERQKILRCAFTGVLTKVLSPGHMAEWGQPNSTERLSKLANSIATFAKNAKRKASRLSDLRCRKSVTD